MYPVNKRQSVLLQYCAAVVSLFGVMADHKPFRAFASAFGLVGMEVAWQRLFCTSCLPTSFAASLSTACAHSMTAHSMTGHMSEQ